MEQAAKCAWGIKGCPITLSHSHKPSRDRVFDYAKRAVREEYVNPHHGWFAGYDREAACDDVLNYFDGRPGKGSSLTVEEDEELIRDAVRAAEDWHEEKYGVRP